MVPDLCVRGLGIVSDSVLRRVRPSRYKTISLHHVETDTGLSWKAVGLLTYLVTRPDGWKFNRRDLVQRHQDGMAAVSSGLRELRDARYIRTKPRPTGGWEWYVSDEPLSVEDWDELLHGKPKVENRTYGPESRKSVDGKSPLITVRSPYQTEVLTTSSNGDAGNAAKRAQKEGFERLWVLARRGSKKKALQQYVKAVPKKVSADSMYAARKTHVERASHLRYVKHLDLWIRDERWDEEVPESEEMSTPPEAGTDAWAAAEHDRIMGDG